MFLTGLQCDSRSLSVVSYHYMLIDNNFIILTHITLLSVIKQRPVVQSSQLRPEEDPSPVQSPQRETGRKYLSILISLL